MSSNPTAASEETTPASESEARIKRFLATASHDLQSPLRHITMYAEMLLDDLGDTLDGEQLQGLQMIMEKAQTAQRLTKALMTFASGTPQVTAGDVSLQTVAEENWAVLTIEAAVPEAVIEAQGLPRIRTDATLIAIVLRSLFLNALIYRGEAVPKVSVTAEKAGADWLIHVSDNGSGIDPAYQGKIFDPFWKLPKIGAVSRPGLGLTTARDIAKALGGDILLEHSDENGSRFAIRLPAI